MRDDMFRKGRPSLFFLFALGVLLALPGCPFFTRGDRSQPAQDNAAEAPPSGAAAGH